MTTDNDSMTRLINTLLQRHFVDVSEKHTKNLTSDRKLLVKKKKKWPMVFLVTTHYKFVTHLLVITHEF